MGGREELLSCQVIINGYDLSKLIRVVIGVNIFQNLEEMLLRNWPKGLEQILSKVQECCIRGNVIGASNASM